MVVRYPIFVTFKLGAIVKEERSYWLIILPFEAWVKSKEVGQIKLLKKYVSGIKRDNILIVSLLLLNLLKNIVTSFSLYAM